MKVILQDGSIVECSWDDELGQEAFHHTTAHILAQAVKRLYPTAKCAIGPAIKNGFYYDFEFDFDFTDDKLPEIEAEMKKIVKENLKLTRSTMEHGEAIALFEEAHEDYKVQLIKDMPEDEVLTFFRQGDYVEMCAGPHVTYTSAIKAFKLLNVAGAYWRGDEHNKMLTRIYGTSFPNKDMLAEYLNNLEEARKRDHRKLGKELKLFALMDEGPGFPFFLPNGMVLKNQLMDYWKHIHYANDYVEISTPVMLNRELWETSGHWDHYRENMYTTKIDDVDFAVKPMNCPGSILVYKLEPRSYRDLPLRLAETGLVHRHEKSGQLHGLMRVRAFTQDDSHIFLMPGQIADEVKRIVGLIDEVYTKFGFKYHVELSTRPEDSMGTDEEWENATNGLRDALEDLGLPYVINEGDGAFYGPKIDFHLEDSIGRTWQCGTIQLDFQLPQRFGIEYTGDDGQPHQPVMIHRVAFGSVERFIGILIEHYAGKFPFWLSPVQIKVLPISDKYADYANKVTGDLKALGYRAQIDGRSEKIGYKIREARNERVPYMLILGEKEESAGTVSIRRRDDEEGTDRGALTMDEFLALLDSEEKAY